MPCKGGALFEPFFDEIDGTCCGPVHWKGHDLAELRNRHRFRFPLVLDAQATFAEQLAASPYAPASSRFGPYCDNILGMNWRLPSGRVVRIGERVAKSTTGYDLLRFLMHSGGRWGAPTDLVMRLRPDFGYSGVLRMRGAAAAVDRAMRQVLGSCWLHWFDSVDVLRNGRDDECELRIALNCPQDEWSVYERHLSSVASSHALRMVMEPGTDLAPDGLPDLVLKTTPDSTLLLGRLVAAEQGWRSVTLAYPGVVHGYREKPELPEVVRGEVEALRRRLEPEVQKVGGDWHSRHLDPAVTALRDDERHWLEILDREFSAV